MTMMGFSLGVWNILLHGGAPDMTGGFAGGGHEGHEGPASPSTEGNRLSWRGQTLTWRDRYLLWCPGGNPPMTVGDKPQERGPPD